MKERNGKVREEKKKEKEEEEEEGRWWCWGRNVKNAKELEKEKGRM